MKAFSREVQKIYNRFPAAYRTDRWQAMVKLVDSGKMSQAVDIGKDQENRYRKIRAENVISRRLRIQRAALFILHRRANEQLQAIFQSSLDYFIDSVSRRANSIGEIPNLTGKIKDGIIFMRRGLNKWLTDHIWFAIRLGFKNAGDTFEPIFQANKKVFQEDIEERAIIEERLSFGITKDLASRGSPKIDETDLKWRKVLDKIYSSVVKTNNRGLKPSERIWDLTRATESKLKRTLIDEIAKGTPSADIAKKLKDYLSPSVTGGEADQGPGIYKSPFKNAMRLARTETTSAYDTAMAEWARDKRWVEGLRIVLSPSHVGPDDCDDIVDKGEIYTPDEIQDILPVHPHCVCQPTPVMKDEYLSLFTEEFVEK